MGTDEKAQGELEILHGLKIAEDGIEISVTSTGYTTKESFRIDPDTGFTDGSVVHISVYRVKPDHGKAMPRVVDLKYSMEELGINVPIDAEVANKFGGVPTS